MMITTLGISGGTEEEESGAQHGDPRKTHEQYSHPRTILSETAKIQQLFQNAAPLNWCSFSFFLCRRTSCARLSAMISIYSGRNKRTQISIAVYLRLTGMDVCCGPPAS